MGLRQTETNWKAMFHPVASFRKSKWQQLEGGKEKYKHKIWF
jgi:hypothetical protein